MDRAPEPAAHPAHAAPLAALLALALTRRTAGVHRLLVGATGPLAERFARAHAGAHARLLYRVRLRPWLEQGACTLDVLYPYRLAVRAAPPGTVAVVDDADALFAPEHAAWRRDPLAARLVRRALLGSRVPTFWCAPSVALLGGELASCAPAVHVGPPDIATDTDAPDPFDQSPSEVGLMVLARV